MGFRELSGGKPVTRLRAAGLVPRKPIQVFRQWADISSVKVYLLVGLYISLVALLGLAMARLAPSPELDAGGDEDEIG